MASTINISFDLLALQGAKRITGKDGKEYVAICIPESRINAHANGKCYLSIDCKTNRDGEDKFGNSHSICEKMTKEERAAKKYTPFIGSGKEFVFDGGGSGGYKKQSTEKNKLPEKPIADGLEEDSIPF
jgi:hypothetical protein